MARRNRPVYVSRICSPRLPQIVERTPHASSTLNARERNCYEVCDRVGLEEGPVPKTVGPCVPRTHRMPAFQWWDDPFRIQMFLKRALPQPCILDRNASKRLT